MKLYLLTRMTKVEHDDEYTAAVVCAHDDVEARGMHPRGSKRVVSKTKASKMWVAQKDVLVLFLGHTAEIERRVILARQQQLNVCVRKHVDD